ncbi:MAG: hypothetical protein ACI8RD_011974, partial [Bacillariaceae sp.]|jgi:hypothetical protein
VFQCFYSTTTYGRKTSRLVSYLQYVRFIGCRAIKLNQQGQLSGHGTKGMRDALYLRI